MLQWKLPTNGKIDTTEEVQTTETSVGNDANHSNENYTTNVERNFNMIQSNALK